MIPERRLYCLTPIIVAKDLHPSMHIVHFLVGIFWTVILPELVD